jgi:hypothetical protein
METITQAIKGSYYDILTDSKCRIQWESDWQSNLIVNNCNLLLATLMKRHEGMEGNLYCAIGKGEKAWDTNRPISLLTDTQLTNEVYRKPISSDQILYLNDDGQPTGIPTNLLEIAVEFRGEDIVPNGSQPLREFGLFGGDATDNADSGYMINHVTHERYDLTPVLTLNRKIRLTFTGGAISQEELTGLGATLPVKSIDGVGDVYASDFSHHGVQTVSDLIDIDPLLPIGDIPLVKLREFRAKARMVMSLKATLAPFAPLADYSISDLLIERPEEIPDTVGSPDITAEMVARLQEELAVLQVALDDAQLQSISLGNLMNI